jgi:signal transduction histidine kinase
LEKIETQLHQASQKRAFCVLAGGMIHDLNNILSSVLGFAELAKIGFRSGATVDKELNEVLNAGRRARDLVSQILACIRQNGSQSMPIEVTVLIKDAMKLIRASLPASIEISFQPGAFKGKILIDPVQFQHVLIIVCMNVSHAMKEKTGLIAIRLQELQLDDRLVQLSVDIHPGLYLQLCIRDAGYGEPEDVIERIVNPFQPHAFRNGSFPGLSLVQEIMQEMGGAIYIGNESEKKNVIHVLFPKYSKESDEGSNGTIIDY